MNSASRAMSRTSLLLCLGAGLGVAPHLTVPGGGQFWWNRNIAGGGAHVYEGWTVAIGGEIPWRIHIVDDAVAPGFPVLSASSIPDVDQPGVQSVVRGLNAWSDAKVPGHNSNASLLRFTSTPTLWRDPRTAPATVMIEDGVNTVSMWVDAVYYGGGGTILGVAEGYLETNNGPATGELVECDVAINATEVDASGVPVFSFLETNTATGWNVASAGIEVPSGSYVDLQGVLTHEFGHAAGIGHSMIDSIHFTMPGLSLMHTPTMFPFAQVEYATDRVVTRVSGTAPPFAFEDASTDFAATDSGGLMGSSAATLEVDDIAALGVAYPIGSTSDFATKLGTIKGRVLGQYGNYPANGVHVTAVRKLDPDVTRVSRLTDNFGNYEIQGLPPGDYHVYIEGADITEATVKTGQAVKWKVGYLGTTIPTTGPITNTVANGALPQYIEQAYAASGNFDGAPIQHLETQFYTGATNKHPAQAATVGVVAGQTATLTDIWVYHDDNAASHDDFRILPGAWITPPTGHYRQWESGSGRGLNVPFTTGMTISLEHRANVGTSPYLDTVTCWVSRARSFSPYMNPGKSIPHVFQLNMDPAVFEQVDLKLPQGGNQFVFDFKPQADDRNQILFFQTVERRVEGHGENQKVHFVPSGNVISVHLN